MQRGSELIKQNHQQQQQQQRQEQQQSGFSLKTDTDRLFTSHSKVVICSFFGRCSTIATMETWLWCFYLSSGSQVWSSWFPNCFRRFGVPALLPVGIRCTATNSAFEVSPVDCDKQRVHPIFPSQTFLRALRQINAGNTSSGFGGETSPHGVPAKSFC